MRSQVFTTAATLALLAPACVVEEIDALIAERGVTYCPTESSSTAGTTSTSTGTSSTGTTDTTTTSTTSTTDASDSLNASQTSETTSTGSAGEPPNPICGDSLVEADEECDDGNSQDGDACRNDCTRRWIVFVTSLPDTQGDFNGILGADYQCRHRATLMFLPNGERYMAWVSTTEVQPADRMHHGRGPYVLVNGLQVAADWDALTSGTLEHPINVNEMGETMVAAVWTGTDITGLRLPNTQHCSDWTYGDSNQTGWIGDCGATDATWTRGVESHCGAGAAIYCIEQP
jgi:cysteine-rich repeat protein